MPQISPKNMAEAIYEATEGKSGIKLNEVFRSVAEALYKKRMLSKSDEILKALEDIFDKKTGTIRMKVTTASKINNEERKKIESEIKEKHKAKSIISEFFEKAELLGGMRVEVGGEVIDSSYRKKLENLKNFLMQEK